MVTTSGPEIERLRAVQTRQDAFWYWLVYRSELRKTCYRVTEDRLNRVVRQNLRYLLEQLRGTPDHPRLAALLGKTVPRW